MQNQEQWKDIPGYEGVYQASDMGQIRRIGSKKSHLKQATHWKGYKTVELNMHGISQKHRVHRLIAITFLGASANKPQVNHKNGIKHDNRAKNLEWATPSENTKHATLMGLNKPPQQTDRSIVDAIRREYACGNTTQTQLAKKYNLHRNTIARIIK